MDWPRYTSAFTSHWPSPLQPVPFLTLPNHLDNWKIRNSRRLCKRRICSSSQTLRATVKPLLHRRGWADTAPHAVTQQFPSDNLACAQLFVSSKMPPSESTTAGLRLCKREGGFVFWKKQLFFRQRRSMERVHNNRNEKWKKQKKGQEGAWIPFRFCSRHTCPRQARWLRTRSHRPGFEGTESYDGRSDCLQEVEQNHISNTHEQRKSWVKHPHTCVLDANTARMEKTATLQHKTVTTIWNISLCLCAPLPI